MPGNCRSRIVIPQIIALLEFITIPHKFYSSSHFSTRDLLISNTFDTTAGWLPSLNVNYRRWKLRVNAFGTPKFKLCHISESRI